MSFDADGKMLELAASLDVADVVEEDGSGKSKPCSSLVFPSCDESLRLVFYLLGLTEVTFLSFSARITNYYQFIFS